MISSSSSPSSSESVPLVVYGVTVPEEGVVPSGSSKGVSIGTAAVDFDMVEVSDSLP